jgi:predicted N-acetyltransferase YhbS
MDVDPAHGQRGIGSALVETVCDWAKLQGYPALSLSTFRDLPWSASFYANLGFRMLDESELTIGSKQIRQQELEAGLPISKRIIMCCPLQPSNNSTVSE